MRVIALAILLLLPACAGSGCTTDERDALRALPLPPGATEVREGANEGACQLLLETPLSPLEVRDHFIEPLAADGWALVQAAEDRELEGVSGGTLLTAQRSPFDVTVDFEDLARYIEPRPGTYVALNLGRQP